MKVPLKKLFIKSLAFLSLLMAWSVHAQDPPWQIYVFSEGASNVSIASDNGYEGVTPYYKYNIPDNTVVNLQAPLTAGGMNFLEWGGCTGTAGTAGSICSVEVTANWSVAAVYVDGFQLRVYSSGASGVPIGSDTGHGGTTHYTLSIAPGTYVRLIPPLQFGDRYFDRWSDNCQIIESRICYFTSGAAHKAVTANYYYSSPEDDFVTTWKTDNPGVSSESSITVPIVGGPFVVDWNDDGVFDQAVYDGPVTHNFGSSGTYTIRIKGSYDTIFFNDAGDKQKILSIDQWGTNAWTGFRRAFAGASNLTVAATDKPDLSMVSDMSGMFEGAAKADPDTSGWDTSSVTDMSFMFHGASAANPDTSNWDTSGVTAMYFMFWDATSATPDTSGWNTSLVTNMKGMFYGAKAANPNTSGWDTSSVTDMSYMFYGATAANPDTGGWKVNSVTDMSSMFQDAPAANPDTGGWFTQAVTDMSFMFKRAISFDQDISHWDITSLTDATDMFSGIALSVENYDRLLISWDSQFWQTGVDFGAGNSRYCSQAAADARSYLMLYGGWTITDGGRCDLSPCKYSVTSPNGGENWLRGTTQSITWSSTGGDCAANVRIELFMGYVLAETIAASTPNDGSLSWSIPAGLTAASSYRIGITDLNTTDYFDASDADFSITRPDQTAVPSVNIPIIEGETSIAGTSEPGAAVEVFIDAASVGTVTADGAGTWQKIGLAPLVVGQQVSARATVAGKAASAVSFPVSVFASPERIFADGFESNVPGDGTCGESLPPLDPPPDPPPQCATVADGICAIVCNEVGLCRDATLLCPEGMPCNIVCDAEESCASAALLCPAGDYACNVLCSGLRACENMALTCGEGPCSISCDSQPAVCSSASMTCGVDSCVANCAGSSTPTLLNKQAACEVTECPTSGTGG